VGIHCVMPYRVAEGPRPQNRTRAETRVSCSYSASFCNPPVTGRDGSSAKRGGNHATQGEPLRQWRRWRQNGVLTFTVPIGVTIAAMIRVLVWPVQDWNELMLMVETSRADTAMRYRHVSLLVRRCGTLVSRYGPCWRVDPQAVCPGGVCDSGGDCSGAQH